jgi:hypothetical protein
VPGGDVLLVTLDALRYDVAQEAIRRGETPNLAAWLPTGEWLRCHAPGSFTYPSHQAMFAGFLPTPAASSRQPRLFALAPGSDTVSARTVVMDAPDIVAGLRGLGYHTACIGGVAFFDKKSPLGRVLPSLFDESHWSRDLSVTSRESARHQMALASRVIRRQPPEQPLFLFINVSALHPPTHFYLPGATRDSTATQRAALRYVDARMPALRDALEARCRARRRRCLAIVCSDHGTTFGDDGFVGHRLAHPAVWEVPYLETVLG